MSDRPTHASDPIDAEFEPADDTKQIESTHETPAKSGGPGWVSLTFVCLIALGSLAVSLWSSGLLKQNLVPTPSSASVADLRETHAAVQARVGELSAQVEGMIDRVDSEIARLETEVAAIEPAPAETPTTLDADAATVFDTRIAAIEQQLADLATAEDNAIDPARIEAIESALASARNSGGDVDSAQLVDIRTELASIKTDLGELAFTQTEFANQIETIRTDATELGRSSQQVVTASLALAAIEATAARGEPFEAEFRQLQDARPDDRDVQALASLSQIGIPPLAELRSQFRELRKQATSRGAADGSGKGWMNTVFGDSVSVRRTESGGETADRLVDAEAALARDDLSIAIDAVEALPDETKPIFQTWLADARRRARLEGALEDMRLKLIAAGQ